MTPARPNLNLYMAWLQPAMAPMTIEERGAFISLITTIWATADVALPDDDQRLMRFAFCNKKQWQRIRPAMERVFVVQDGKWTCPQLTREADRVAKTSHKQRTISERRWAPKPLMNNDRGDAMAYPMGYAHVHEGKKDSTSSSLPSENHRIDSAAASQRQAAIDGPVIDVIPPSHPSPHAKGDLFGEQIGSTYDAPTPRQQVFGAGLKYLKAENIDEARARVMLGKWRKEHGDWSTLAAIEAARNAGVSEPISYITQVLKENSNGKGRDDHRRQVPVGLDEGLRQAIARAEGRE